MRRLGRENALCALAAAAAGTVIAWLGLYGFAWNDYETEAKPAFDALMRGHVLEFLRLAPAYGGSLVERAPFALLPGLWGGGQLAVYRIVALPCLLATVMLAVWLCAHMRTHTRTRATPTPRRATLMPRRATLARALVVVICVANPLTLQALELGHPEELLGACLCVGAVLLAARDRPLWAGLLLGLAVANKEWALVAVGPVLLALPTTRARDDARGDTAISSTANTIGLLKTRISGGRRQLACLASAGAACGFVLMPLLLASGGQFAAGARADAATSGALFQPWQVWWFFGWHGSLVRRPGPMPGYRTGPAWAGAISHPLIVVVGLGLAAALWWQRQRRQTVWTVRADSAEEHHDGDGLRTTARRAALSERDALLALALVLLVRCVLDTWDTGYYMLPFLLALLAWEALDAKGRAPLLTLVGVVAPWVVLKQVSAQGISPDAQAGLFLVWTAPFAAALAFALFAPRRAARLADAWRQMGLAKVGSHRPHEDTAPGRRPAQETTVSSLGSPVSMS